MSDNKARARELAQWLFNEPPTESEIKFLASALDAAELRGKREGLMEARSLVPDLFWNPYLIFDRLAALGTEPEGK